MFHGSDYVNDVTGLKCKLCFSCTGVSEKTEKGKRISNNEYRIQNFEV
jgi:hypothetical protein